MATFRVNFGFKNHKNYMRQGSLIINGKDAKDAQEQAKKQLNSEYDWYNLTSIKELDSTKSIV